MRQLIIQVPRSWGKKVFDLMKPQNRSNRCRSCDEHSDRDSTRRLVFAVAQYFAALAVTTLMVGALNFLLQQEITTSSIRKVSQSGRG